MEYDVIIAACVFLTLAVFGNLLLRCIVNPITVFCTVWGVILLAYSFHAYGLYYASSLSLSLIVVGVSLFFFGAVVAMILFRRNSNSHGRITVIDENAAGMNYTVMLLLNIISFAFLIGFGLSAIRDLLSGSDFYYIHKMYNDEEGMIAGSKTYRNMITWFVWPLLDASLAAMAASILCDKENTSKKKKLFIILTLLNLALFIIISGKRLRLLNVVMFFIAVFYLQGRRVKLKGRTKLAIAVGLVATLWAFNYISVGRGTQSIVRSLYVYLVGCVPHLSSKLSGTVNPKGLTSVYGFFQPILIIVNSVFHSSTLNSIRNSMSDLAAYTQVRTTIGPGMTFNAFLTPFYFFYLDGGVIGNVVLSFLFGFFSMGVYYNHIKKRSYQSLLLYLLVFFSLYMSMVRIQFFQMRYVLSFAYTFLFFIKPKVKIVFQKGRFQDHVNAFNGEHRFDMRR